MAAHSIKRNQRLSDEMAEKCSDCLGTTQCLATVCKKVTTAGTLPTLINNS